MTNAASCQSRLLAERPIAGDAADRPASGRRGRSRSTWPKARSAGCSRAGHVSRRQFDAGERLRVDWERAQLAPRVTMTWDAAPVARSRGGSAQGVDLSGAQIDARRRFEPRSPRPGRAWPTYCGGWFAPARACARPKPRSAGRRAPASWCWPRARPGRRLLPHSLAASLLMASDVSAANSASRSARATTRLPLRCSCSCSFIVGSRRLLLLLPEPLLLRMTISSLASTIALAIVSGAAAQTKE